MTTMAKSKPNSRSPRPASKPVQVPVRMEPATREALERDAAKNFRTINMHILWLIQQRLDALEREQGGHPCSGSPPPS